MPRQVERLLIMCIPLLPLTLLPMHPAIAEEAAPDAGFLEYLGQMVEEDGEYLDLMDLADVEDLPAEPVNAQTDTGTSGPTETAEVAR